MPLAKAIALMVVVLLTVIDPPYGVPTVEVGVLPSSVYRIDAVEVAVLMLTVCAAL